MVYVLRSNNNDWLFALGIAGVRESVETRVVGLRSLISCRQGIFHIMLYKLCGMCLMFYVRHCLCILGAE